MTIVVRDEVLPLTIREYCDRPSDLAVEVRWQDGPIHGEGAALITHYPGVPKGLRDLVETAVH